MDVRQVLIPLIAICICTDISEGYFIHIDAHAEECFFDRVNSGSKMSLMFEVAEGGFLDIDVKVRLNSEFNSNQPTSVGRRSWSVTSVGCFNNETCFLSDLPHPLLCILGQNSDLYKSD